MSLEDLYFASDKSIKKPVFSGLSKLVADHSRLNIDVIPNSYNTEGRFVNLKDGSRLNIDVIPKKYHG